MFKRNAGRMTAKITLMQPSANTRDELGGLSATTYTTACTLFAMCTQRNQSRAQVIGDYVTTDTRYFIMRDISSVASGIDTQWRLLYDGRTYLINQVEQIDESRPYYTQITATAVNAGGGL